MAVEQSRVTGAIGGAGQGAGIGFAVGGPIGGGIGAAIGGIGGFLSGGGEDDAQQLAEDQAKNIERTAIENKRRSMLQMQSTLGQTKAATYASNLQFSGSSKKYYGALKSQFRSDMAWETLQSRMNAEFARKGGDVVADQIKSSGISSAISGLGSAAASGAFGSFENGAYKSPFG